MQITPSLAVRSSITISDDHGCQTMYKIRFSMKNISKFFFKFLLCSIVLATLLSLVSGVIYLIPITKSNSRFVIASCSVWHYGNPAKYVVDNLWGRKNHQYNYENCKQLSPIWSTLVTKSGYSTPEAKVNSESYSAEPASTNPTGKQTYTLSLFQI